MANGEVLKTLDWDPMPRFPVRKDITRVEFLDREHILLCFWTQSLKVLSTSSGRTIWDGRYDGTYGRIASSANGRYLLYNESNRLKIIDLEVCRDLVGAKIAKADDPHFIMSEDGGTVLGMWGNRTWQFDPSTLGPLRAVNLAGSPVTLSRDGRFCVTDRPGAVWEPASETILCPLADAAQSPLADLGLVGSEPFALCKERFTFHRNGRWLLHADGTSAGGGIDLWGGGRLDLFRFSSSGRDIRDFCSPDGRLSLARADDHDQEVICYEIQTATPVWHGPPYGFDYPRWLKGGQCVAYPNNDGNFEIRDAQTGKIMDNLISPTRRARILAIAPDGSSYVLGGDGQAQIREWVSRKPVLEIPFRGYQVRYLPGGRFLVVCGDGGMTTVWDLSSAAAKRKPNESAAGQLTRLWPDLAGSDARRAFAASWAFVASGNEAVAVLAKRLTKEKPHESEAEIRRLIVLLDSDEYQTRSDAYERLHALGREIIPHLEKAARETKSLEANAAIQKLLRSFTSGEETPVLRRAGFILRQIGTPQAEELLAKLGEYSAQKAFAPLPAPKSP